MNETTGNAIVAKAPAHLDAVVRLAKEIDKAYATANGLRKKANQAGLALGRQIIEACFDDEIMGTVLKLNAKDQKKTGGTHTKVYSFVCDQLAEIKGYNADYLKQCARNYLVAFNKHRVQNRDEPLELKTGVFTKTVKNPPQAEQLEAFVQHPPHPRMDDVAKDENEPASESPDENEIIEKKIGSLISLFLAPDGTPRFNPKAFKILAKKIQPYAEAHGYAIAPVSKQSVNER